MARPAHRTPAIAAWVAANPLRQWRTVDLGLTIAETARLLNVTTAALGHWETGVRLPSANTRRHIHENVPHLFKTLPLAALDTWFTQRPEEN